jgi:hypothetical protein
MESDTFQRTSQKIFQSTTKGEARLSNLNYGFSRTSACYRAVLEGDTGNFVFLLDSRVPGRFLR